MHQGLFSLKSLMPLTLFHCHFCFCEFAPVLVFQVIFVRGHFATSASVLEAGIEPTNQQRVFVALCCPAVTSDFKDGGLSLLYNTTAFVSIHSLDMKYLEISTR
jgi:hypothetical protein